MAQSLHNPSQQCPSGALVSKCCCCCVDSEPVAVDVEVDMGKASREKRKLNRFARFQPQEFTSFADLASLTKEKVVEKTIGGMDNLRSQVSSTLNNYWDKEEKASTAFGSHGRTSVEPKSKYSVQPLSAMKSMTSRIKEAQTMNTSRIQSFVSTVFKGKGATAMGGNGMKRRWPVLGAMVVLVTGVLGYYGYNALQGSDSSRSGNSAPTYQYQAEKPAQTAPSHSNATSGSSFFSTAKVAEVLNLRKASGHKNIQRTTHGKSGRHSARLHKKGKHGHHKTGHHSSRHAMKKRHGGGNIHQASHKKHGHRKGGHLAHKSKKKKHHVAHH